MNKYLKKTILIRKIFFPPPIISIHIPKTAGTSFLRTLNLVYNHKFVSEDYYGTIPKKSFFAKIIHGHFPANKYDEIFPYSKKITWLRDPTERIISWYYYWQNNLFQNDERYLFFVKNKPTLVEFSELNFVKNELVNFYFKNCPIETFTFIGFTENYKEGINSLGKILNWEKKYYLHSNSNSNKKEIGRAEREKIKSNLKEEYRIYKEAKKLFK